MEYRIEELARAAGVAVDTIRFYQGKGLLEAPRREGRVTWYGDHHLDRLGRIRALQHRGFSLAVIRRFLAGELESSDEALVAAVTAPLPDGGESLTLEELAARSGVAVPLLQALAQAGLLVPIEGDSDTARFPSSDLAAISAGLQLVEAGIPLLDLLSLASDHARATEETARRAVDLFDQHVRERLQASAGGSAVGLSARLMDSFEDLLEASAGLVEHHFRRTLMRAAREHIESSGPVVSAHPSQRPGPRAGS